MKGPNRLLSLLRATPIWAALGALGCAAPPVKVKLARVGLELLSEGEAGIPERESGRYVPCRVRADFPRPALPPHPAGYLFVGVDGAARDAKRILEALKAWRPGETIRLTVRRNPFLEPRAEWWEYEVHLRLPAVR